MCQVDAGYVVLHFSCNFCTQVVESEDMLSAGYGLLENIIGFLASGPELGLNSRQVTQLHTALMGAFNAIIYFLTQVRDLCPEKVTSLA